MDTPSPSNPPAPVYMILRIASSASNAGSTLDCFGLKGLSPPRVRDLPPLDFHGTKSLSGSRRLRQSRRR